LFFGKLKWMKLKKFLPLLPALLLAGCVSGTFTRLTPNEQPRNANNLYPVETIFASQQQSLRWDSIQAYVLVNGQPYPMRPEPIVQNRWEGFVPVPPTENQVTYRFKFDYLYNAFGNAPKPNSEYSKAYVLKVLDQ
jgi:hypothetical protein